MQYRHTQTGWMALGGLAVGALVMAGAAWANGSWLEFVPGFLILGLIGSQMARMTVAVDRGRLVVMSGTGHLRKVIHLADVATCEPVRNHWMHGWGLRWIPGGWLINVSGLDAVELTYRAGGKLRIGTDQPWQLADAVQAELEPAG